MTDVSLHQELIGLYRRACRLDITALKPGNVGLHSDSQEPTVKDFVRSAQTSTAPLMAPGLGLGERILGAVRVTRQAVDTNTNLGIILLISPLVQAVMNQGTARALEDSLATILKNTTVEDAASVYQAIRLAEPGGMGRKDEQDLFEEPTATLLEAMRIAASWDQVAAQYSNGFYDVFHFGVPRYTDLLEKWRDERWATTGLFLSYLAHFPDSLIARKSGILKAREISDMITPLQKEFCRSNSPDRYRARLMKIDGHLKRDRINPGTTADLVLTSIFAVGLMQL